MRKPRQEIKSPQDPSSPRYADITLDNNREETDSTKNRLAAVSQEICGLAAENSSTAWLATITLDNARDGTSSTKDRLETISQVITNLAAEGYPTGGVLLFPGGWLDAREAVPDADYCKRTTATLAPALQGTGHTVCFGIDGGKDAEGFARDQLALAVREGEGICAMGRKFAPSPQEVGHVSLCKNFAAGEAGYPRNFTHRGKTFFLAVCYDVYGISHGAGPNPGADAVLNCVHCFYPQGQGPSGVQYFAKLGFAGASKQWGCPVFGTAVFYDRNMPVRWPTGVMWTSGEKSTKKWRYDENPLVPSVVFGMKKDKGKITVRVFDGGW